jgi:hypothetical protein
MVLPIVPINNLIKPQTTKKIEERREDDTILET